MGYDSAPMKKREIFGDSERVGLSYNIDTLLDESTYYLENNLRCQFKYMKPKKTTVAKKRDAV